MTRVNLVDPSTLCDQHLLAELREIKRIPNAVLAGRVSLSNIPKRFTVRLDAEPERGSGHVKFFYDKLLWLQRRYTILHNEASQRGFNVSWMWPEVSHLPDDLLGEWIPSKEDIRRSRARIEEAMPPKPRFTGKNQCKSKPLSVSYICAGSPKRISRCRDRS